MSSSLYLHVSQRLVASDMVWPGSDAAPIIGFVPEDDYLRRLGAVLRASRKMRQLSQEELGDRVGRDKNSISRWERGATSLSAYNLSQLWEALGIPPEWLLEPTDSLSELDRRIAQLRRAAAEAARDDAGEGPSPASGDGRGAPRGRR